MLTSLPGRVAVVTGAGSGIGRALARRLAGEGMQLALADVEPAALEQIAQELLAAGAEVLAYVVDVADEVAYNGFAEAVLARWNTVHLLCNNAGVGGGWSPIWAATRTDWDWMLGVNLYGAVHGLRAFIPAMLAAGEEGHVVNTSSVAGLMTGPGQVYDVTKHAVQRLSEGLWYDLQGLGSKIGVSAVCPGIVATQINTAARNRPASLVEPGRSIQGEVEYFRAMDAEYAAIGMPPEQVADLIVDAVRDNTFYVLPHPWIKDLVRTRAEAVCEQTRPPQVHTRAATHQAPHQAPVEVSR